VSFKNTILIMTSNISAEYIQEESKNITDTNRDVVYGNMKINVLDTLRRSLRPEFLNRVDESIVFSALTRDEIKEIVRLQLHRLEQLLSEKEITLKIKEEAVDYIASSSYDQTYGARPIKRFINKQLSQQIAKMILAGQLKNKQVLLIGYADNELQLTAIDNKTEDETG